MAHGDQQVRMTISLPLDAARFLQNSARTDWLSKNALIVRAIREAMQEKGPAEAATSPSRAIHPTSQKMEKMMRKHNTAAPDDTTAALRAIASRPDLEDEILDLHRVGHLLEVMDDLLSGPFDASDARRRYFQAATIIDFARERLSDTIRVLEGGEA